MLEWLCVEDLAYFAGIRDPPFCLYSLDATDGFFKLAAYDETLNEIPHDEGYQQCRDNQKYPKRCAIK